jgi:hypothetical protein
MDEIAKQMELRLQVRRVLLALGRYDLKNAMDFAEAEEVLLALLFGAKAIGEEEPKK